MKSRQYLFASILMLLIFISCNTDSPEPDSNFHFIPSSVTNVENILFVGVTGETPSLYKYDLNQNKYQQLWYKPREIVVDLSMSPNYLKAFFITALSIEEGGTLPLIRKVKLYLVDLKSLEVKHIKNYGNTGQIITNWEDENNYKIVMNTFDKTIATDIIQTTQLFNGFGKLLLDESKTFELLKDGYPHFPKAKINFESPSKRYYLQVSDNNQAYYLNDRTTKQYDTISSYPFYINQSAWSFEDKYLTISYSDQNLKNPGTNKMNVDSSSIIIYSLTNKRIQREWQGNGLKNFTQLNDLIIFDNGFGSISELVIYNFKTDKVINNIRLKRGCGLKNIPGVFIYDVVD